MDMWGVLFDILILLMAALVLGAVCERLKQSPILGYLVAGTILGPNALGFVASAEEVTTLAELGVALLLFTIGLEFSWPRLRRLGPAALGGGAGQVIVTMGLGCVVALGFGMELRTSVVIGAIMALSSTACVLRLLVSRAEIESVHGRQALGILLMQDVAVVPLVLLVTMLGGGGSFEQVGVDVFSAVVGACVLIGVLYVLLNVIAPRVLGLASVQRNRDLPILLAIVVGLGSAWGSHKLGLSPALGAFVAGMILAESPFATQIRADIGSLRTLLMTLFFSSIGMLGDPGWFVQNLPAVGALVLAIVVGKSVVIWVVLKAFRITNSNALASGICLAQVGEFSFVLIAVGRGTVIGEELFALLISATIVTLFLTPYLVAGGPRVSILVVGWLEKMKVLVPSVVGEVNEESQASGHLVIVGFGPAGQMVGRAVVDSVGGVEHVAVVDLSPSMVRAAQLMGFEGHIGDASQPDVLEHVGILRAGVVVVAIPDPAGARRTIELIRSLAPEVYIIARARYHRYIPELEASGAHEVIDEEELVGDVLAKRLGVRLGGDEESV
ncbi:sodium:proton exchanger [bacterium]|nr:MAG: sodium:proton exchanger [bacterium]